MKFRLKIVSTRSIDYSKVDWNKQDVVIADELGISRERVRQKRLELNIPKPAIRRWCFRKKNHLFLSFINNHSSEFKDKTAKEILELIRQQGIQEGTLNSLVAKLNELRIPFRKKNLLKYHWKEINWDLPNLYISQIWKIKGLYVGTHRYRNQKPSPKWNVQFGWNKDNPELLKAVEIERNKANNF